MKYYSKILCLRYEKIGKFFKFEDGVVYNPTEISILINDKDNVELIKKIHLAKKVFDGILVENKED